MAAWLEEWGERKPLKSLGRVSNERKKIGNYSATTSCGQYHGCSLHFVDSIEKSDWKCVAFKKFHTSVVADLLINICGCVIGGD